MNEVTGAELHDLARRLFPICRSISGDGVRQSFRILKDLLPDLQIHEVASGTKIFDWTVPPEWNIRGAYIVTPDGERICDFQDNNLHVVGYSEPVDQEMSLSELSDRLHSLPDQPDAIPYRTSYYKRSWGFCLTHKQREQLKEGRYRVVIDSTLEPGHLTYADLVLPGDSKDEIFVSCYTCHPSMANDNTSGIVLATFLAKHFAASERRRHTMRFVFVPETIGSLVYLNRHLTHLQERVRAGFNLTCVGDEGGYSFLSSRIGNTLADRAARHTLTQMDIDYKAYDFLSRGSDERQYCAPRVNLPVVSIMRSKFHTFPEYHTSLDTLDFVTPDGLYGAFVANRRAIEVADANETLITTTVGEPHLSKYGLKPSLSSHVKNLSQRFRLLSHILGYSDGQTDLLTIADMLNVAIWDLVPIVDELKHHGLLADSD